MRTRSISRAVILEGKIRDIDLTTWSIFRELMAHVESPAYLKGDVRFEHDSLGEREIPDRAYYGVQTLRAMENFPISGVYVKNFEHMIWSWKRAG